MHATIYRGWDASVQVAGFATLDLRSFQLASPTVREQTQAVPRAAEAEP
jgi:hypothetical protein